MGTGLLGFSYRYLHSCEFAWGCIWTWKPKPKVGSIFPVIFCLFWLIWMWLQSGNSLNVLEPWWFLILPVMCTSHFCFSEGRIKESVDRSCFFRLWRIGARLPHLATRWHCSHKEVWSQLHSSAVALRQSSKAEVGKGQPVWLWLSWTAGLFGSWCMLDASRPLTAKKSIWLGSEVSHLCNDMNTHM